MIVEREEVRECKKERKRQGRWWEQGWNGANHGKRDRERDEKGLFRQYLDS